MCLRVRTPSDASNAFHPKTNSSPCHGLLNSTVALTHHAPFTAARTGFLTVMGMGVAYRKLLPDAPSSGDLIIGYFAMDKLYLTHSQTWPPF